MQFGIRKTKKEIYPQNYTPISLRIWEVWKIPSKCMIFSFVTTYEVLGSFLWSYWHYTFMKRAPNLPFEAHLQVSFFQSHFLLNSLYIDKYNSVFSTLQNCTLHIFTNVEEAKTFPLCTEVNKLFPSFSRCPGFAYNLWMQFCKSFLN